MKPENTQHAEHAEPYEQHNPVPKVVLGLVFALVVWAVSYIFLEKADGIASLGDRRNPTALVDTATPAVKGIDGAQLFAANCQACHQASGQGLPGVFPPLAGSTWVNGDPATLLQILLHGLTGSIEVAGATYNGAMPAFGAQLSDAEIAALATYIRSQWGNNAEPIETGAVTTARKVSEAQAESWQGQDGLIKFMTATAVENSVE